MIGRSVSKNPSKVMVNRSVNAEPVLGVTDILPPAGGIFTFTTMVLCEGMMYVGS